MVLLHLDTACRGSTQVLWPMTYKAAGALSPPRVDSSTYSQIKSAASHACMPGHPNSPSRPPPCSRRTNRMLWHGYTGLLCLDPILAADSGQTGYTCAPGCLAPNPTRWYLRHRIHPTYLPKPTSTKSTQRSTPRHIVIKMGKVKDKDTILKATQENKSQRRETS